jgi:hypothetical protein
MTRAAQLDYGFAGNSKHGRYYRHSGQINAGGVVAALVAGLVAGGLMAGVYSALIVFVPFIKLRGIACFFYGFGLGVVPAALLKKFKMPNVPVSMAVVGVITLVSYYLCWASWEAFVLRGVAVAPSFSRIVVHPNVVYNIAKVADEFGTWSLGGPEAMTGTALLGIWIVEALIIFGCALLIARSMLRDLPFCEKCQQWCGGAKTVRLTAPTDVNELRSKLESGDFAFVAGLPDPTGGAMLTFMHHQCGTCRELNTLTVMSRVIRKDKKGRVQSNKATTAINKLLVTADDVAKLKPAVAGASAAVPIAAVPSKPAAAPAKKSIKSPQAL